MKCALSILIGLAFCINNYAQEDTVVRVDNTIIVGNIVEATSEAVIINLSGPDLPNQIKLGKHLIAYIKYDNGELRKFKYNKWRRKTIKNPLLKNGFYFDQEIGYLIYQRKTWNTDLTTNEQTFSDKTESYSRIGFNIGNRWSLYKTPTYNLSLGVNWLHLSFSPTEFHLLETSFYSDWMFTAGLINPEFTNTFVLNDNSALELYVGGGYMNHLGEETNGYMIRSGLRYRYNIIGLGVNYIYGRLEDGTFGYPITLNTINFTVGFKF